MSGSITLIGAGELMSATSHLHRAALARVDGPLRAVFLDTTAGFESNADAIVKKAVDYYRHHLQMELHVARYRHANSASTAETAAAVAEIRASNFIFAGPGSPTYAIKQWQGSPVWEAVVEQFEGGAHVLFASAAVITLGRYSLPVYEIYKAGYDPFWVDGLDLLGRLGLKLAVVPHFNDNSGGENYDSRYCYIGAKRFDMLQEQLPPDVAILGIDAYTAVTLDPRSQTATVAGQGGITLSGDGAQAHRPSGSAVPFSVFHSSHRGVVPTFSKEKVYTGYEYSDEAEPEPAVDSLNSYIQSLGTLNETEKIELMARVQKLREEQSAPPSVQVDALVDLILELRAALREAKRYDLGDRARNVLTDLGYVVGDSPDGSTWKRG